MGKRSGGGVGSESPFTLTYHTRYTPTYVETLSEENYNTILLVVVYLPVPTPPTICQFCLLLVAYLCSVLHSYFQTHVVALFSVLYVPSVLLFLYTRFKPHVITCSILLNPQYSVPSVKYHILSIL
jgi:hypothetical protein